MVSTLRASLIGIRVFDTSNDVSSGKISAFAGYLKKVEEFQSVLTKKLGDDAPGVIVITNRDLDATRRSMFDTLPLRVVEGNPTSYADMLGALALADAPETDRHFYMSWDMAARDPMAATEQLVAMNTVYDAWQEKKPDSLALLGSLLGAHDRALIMRAIEGEDIIQPSAVSRVFPLNTFSETAASTRFSAITDNGRLGKIEIEESGLKKDVPIGGNEDFYFGFAQMLAGRDCVLLIDPNLSGERSGEVQGHAAKYLRRQKVYEIYMDRLVREALPSQELTHERIQDIATDAIHRHLFFVRINTEGKPEVILTAQQREIGVTSPLG